MRCFYYPVQAFVPGESLELSAELKRHILTVLRLKDGQPIVLFDGCGQVANCRLGGDGVAAVEQVYQAPTPRCELTLIQGLPKGEKLELILQKGTELGVNRFILVPMERSVGSLKEGRQDKKIQRWEKIIQEAARQCRQFYLPTLDVCSYDDALRRADADLRLLLWEDSSAPLDQVISKASPRSAAVIVGPEGGISEAEGAQAVRSGYSSVSMGPRILRTETAGLAVISVLQYIFGDMALGH